MTKKGGAERSRFLAARRAAVKGNRREIRAARDEQRSLGQQPDAEKDTDARKKQRA